MTKRHFMLHIKKVAVLGSGVMGSAIACQLANIGMDVLLLDMPNKNKKGDESTIDKNSIVNDSLKNLIKSKPAPLYIKEYANRISTGNFDDDLKRINQFDWIIEVIIENLEIKKSFYEKIEEHRKPGTIISTNTSSIPINQLAEGRSEDFCKNFFGTHFFNPPRYLRLLEVIPGTKTDPNLINNFMDFGREFLGKETVLCKDTPAFIANRIGIFSISKLMELTVKHALDIETCDQLSGTVIGRPKTGTFRLQDLIGIDVGEKVLESVVNNCPDDAYLIQKKKEGLPEYLRYLLDNKFLGNKSGKGFYYKTKDRDDLGRSIIKSFDLNTLEYRPKKKTRLESIGTAKKIDNLPGKINSFFEGDDKGNKFIQEYFISLFAYVCERVPEISDQLYSIDNALKAGYGWGIGPFEYFDIIGLEKAITQAETMQFNIPDWVKEMPKNGFSSFYKVQSGKRLIYDPIQKKYINIPGSQNLILLNHLTDKIVFKNSEARIIDIGDGVLCLEFISKNNVIGEGTGEAMHKAVDLAENEGWKGIVIGNNAANFTVGANLMIVAMLSFQKEWEQLGNMVKAFQDVNMRLRYARVPVVTATRGYVFGGGIEMSMHADHVLASAESYIGLVEVGVGLLPGGGGTKEFALRLSESFHSEDLYIPRLIEMFRTLAMAEVATSASMAFDYKYLLKHRDEVVLNDAFILHRAKEKVLAASANYLPPSPAQIKVLGRSGLAALYTAINEFKLGNFISEHDALIARKIAWVMCGGDLSAPQYVSEQYLLDLEKEAFISLCGEAKTLDRIQYTLQFNKPLRN